MKINFRMMLIKSISANSAQNIEVKGKMLDDKFGIFAVRVFKEIEKDELQRVGPEKIEFDRKTKDFCVLLSYDHPFTEERKFLEFYVRGTPDSIPYKFH